MASLPGSPTILLVLALNFYSWQLNPTEFFYNNSGVGWKLRESKLHRQNGLEACIRLSHAVSSAMLDRCGHKRNQAETRFLLCLLITTGTIETNPGPTSGCTSPRTEAKPSLRFLLFNAQSISSRNKSGK